jgi:hypothetical protein
MRPVKMTWAAVYPFIGTKKSAVLTVVPPGVASVTGPDRELGGTTVLSVVVVAAVTNALGCGSGAR